MKRKYLLLFGIISVAINAHAQSQSNGMADSLSKARQLNEVLVTEGKRKLLNDSASSTLKLDVPLLHIPQNVISISSVLLKEQGVFVLKDAARNASGVYFGLNNNVFDGASNLYMRGFSQNSIFRNGLPSGDFSSSQDDEAVIDRIEFIKGPAGFLGSSGEAGGRINVVTKTPGPNRILNATITVGSFNFYRASIDLGSAVKEKGFSYRLNGVYNYQEYFVDIMKGKKFVIAPVVQYNFTKQTSLLAEYILNDTKAIGGSTFTKYFPEDQLLKDRKRANYQADPGLPNSFSKSQNARLVFKHEFNKDWRITSQSSYSKNPSDVWSFLSEETYNSVGFDESGKTNRLSFRGYNKNSVLSTQLFVNGNFNTGKIIRHHVMVGGEYFTTKDSTFQSYGLKSFPFEINNLQYGINRDSLLKQETFNGFKYDNNWTAAYFYNTVNIGSHIVFTFGGRYTSNKRENNGVFAPAIITLKQKAFTPRIGLSYLIDPNTAAFFLYDQSFVPTGGQDRQGKAFEPIRGDDKEIGIKRNWMGGLLSTTVTAFDIARNNMTTADPADVKFKKQIGQVRSKGIEIDIIGSISQNFSVSANYSYTKAKITKDTTPEIVGRLYASSPKEVINTWIRYAFPANLLAGLSLTLGQTTIIKKATTTVDVFIPDYTKFDGSIAYTRGRLTTRLLLDNLTNKRYIMAGDIYGGNGYYSEGMPFNFKLSLGFRL